MNLRLSYSMKVARACIALAAAYALALQVLLASTMAAGMVLAPADATAVCYGDTSGGQQPSHSPASSADCILSCAQGLSAAAILPPDISSARISAIGRSLEQGPAADVIVSPRLSPKLAQGPPQHA